MNNTYDFDSKKNEGRKIEELIIDFCKTLPSFYKIQDVHADMCWRDKGVDIILWYKDTQDNIHKTLIDVKGDTYNTGNFYFEYYSDEANQTPGCFIKSYADWFYYYFWETELLYCLPLPKVRKWWETNRNRFKDKRTKISSSHGRTWNSCGSCVPIATVLEEIPNIRIIDLKEYNKEKENE